ncbi:MAG: winged helix-turn-helix domain-containing protein [Colwellia sp.]|nr:winged helix-turn-helix domain-containing protein [Colwellia sp.]
MPIYQFGQFHFDECRGSLTSLDEELPNSKENQVEIQLRHKVANLLAYLIKNSTRIISKEELLTELWQHGDYRENSLTQSIRELRSALGDKAKAPSFIKTFPQRGYQWIHEVSAISHNDSADVNKTDAVKKNTGHVSVDEVPTKHEQDVRRLVVEKHTDECEANSTQSPDKSTSKSSNNNSSKNLNTQRNRYITLAAVLVFFLVLLLLNKNTATPSQQDNPATAAQSAVKSLLVLPFINATEKPSMAWLELGLADMLAIDLQRHGSTAGKIFHVTPPAVANALLLNAQLQWPTLPIHIRSLLREHNIEAAIFASVRLHKNQQVLDFQIIYANGKTQQGSISYPSLPGALQSISQQLLHLLDPNKKRPLASVEDNPIASQAIAQGMQALQKEGPARAKKYFQAALLLEEENHWAQAYSARSSFDLGLWQEAEHEFANISASALADDASLDAFIHYWLAEISYRRGAVDVDNTVNIAITKAEAASDAKQMVRSYRLKANIAWQKHDWPAHKEWSAKAHSLFAVNNELYAEADKLFYLGRPSNAGLEKSPDNDLQENQANLLKALNFYQQLGNQGMIAASQFAIAQNYSFDLATRASALQHTLALYKTLQQPYELAQALNYAGFYQMQLHNGHTASGYFSQARAIAQTLGAKHLAEMSNFYLAFAQLDQGLDQSALGRHGKEEKKLHLAVSSLETFIANTSSQELHASALVFLGWANTELGQFDLALVQLTEAKNLNIQLSMLTTLAYSNYSIMRIHLERGDYPAVIAMADEKITTRLQASFLARAYYEASQAEQAIQVLSNFKISHASLWQGKDEIRLAQYQASLAGAKLNLADEPKAHLIYCESDWQL